MSKITIALYIITTITCTVLFLNAEANKLSVDDVFISVSTYERHGINILLLILKTWYPLAVNQTWFFSNYANETIRELINNSTTKSDHFILANCVSPTPYDCCKMSAALNSFLVVMSKEPVDQEAKMLLKKNGAHYFYEKTDITATVNKKKKRNRKAKKGKKGKKHKSKIRNVTSSVYGKSSKLFSKDAQSLDDEILYKILKYKNRYYEKYLRKIRALPEVGHLDEIGPAFEIDTDYEAREEPLKTDILKTENINDTESKQKKTNATDVKSTEKSFKKYESSTTMPELSTDKSKSFDTNSSHKKSVGNKDSKTFIIFKKGSSVKTNPESSTAELMSRQKYSEGDTIRSIFQFRNSVDAAINRGVWANTYKSSESEIEEEILKDAEALIHPANKVKIYAREPKWFCHFDDRTYVNVNQLVNVLQRFNYLDEWYLGKKHRNVSLSKLPSRRKKYRVKKIFYSSNTGGFCLSLGMIHKIKHYIRGDRFNQFCAAYDLKDDAALGFIIIHLLKIELFNLPEFHSRKEHIKFKPMQSFREQVSFSFKEANTFQSLHCFLYPRSQYCKTPQMQQTLKDMFTGDHFTDDDDDDGDKYDDDEEDDDD